MLVEVGSKWSTIRRNGVDLVGPSGQRRGFVVDEETTVLYGGSLLDFRGLERINGFMGFSRYVCKPVPWRDTNLLRDIVDTVDGTSTIAACEVSVPHLSEG